MAIQGGSGDYIKRIGVLVENLKKKNLRHHDQVWWASLEIFLTLRGTK